MTDMKKILIVDGAVFIHKVFIDTLGQENFVFLKAYDGIEALEIFKRENPDLVILDLGIPEIEQGFGILDFLITKGTDVQVIVITASKDHKHALEAQKKGANSYFLREKI